METTTLHTLNLQKADILFVYENVIKNPDAFILKKIVKDFRSKFEEYMDTNIISTLDITPLTLILIDRNDKNVLRWVSKKEFDYESNYNFLHKQFLNMYNESIMLDGGKILLRFIHSFCIGNIYIWNPVDDKRQRYDIVKNFGGPNVMYITGDLGACIDKYKPKLVYDWDADRIYDLVRTNEHKDTLFGIANYGFNFEKDNPYLLKNELFMYPNVTYYVTYHRKPEDICRG